MKTFILFGGVMFVSVFAYAQTKHVIQRGETLELIAKRYEISTEVIKKANSLIDQFYTGLTISIPDNSESFNVEKDENRKENTLEYYKDVLIYDLKERVKTCVWYSKNDIWGPEEFEEKHSKEFDYNGKEIVHNGDGYLIKRDQMNRIIQTQVRVDYDTSLFVNEFHGFLGSDYKYNIDGKIESEIHWRLKDGKATPEYYSQDLYFYDFDRNIKKIIDKDLRESGRIDLVTEYEYLSFDKYGNWTERKFVDPLNLSEITEKRVITYFE